MKNIERLKKIEEAVSSTKEHLFIVILTDDNNIHKLLDIEMNEDEIKKYILEKKKVYQVKIFHWFWDGDGQNFEPKFKEIE